MGRGPGPRGDAASAADIEAQAFAALGRFAPLVRVGRGDDATAVMAEAAEATRAAGSPCLLQQWLAALHAWRAEVDGDHDGVVDALVPWDPRTLTRAVRPLLPSAATMQVRALARLDRLDEARTLLARLDDPVSPAERAWHHAAARLAWAGGDVRALQRSPVRLTLPGGTEHSTAGAARRVAAAALAPTWSSPGGTNRSRRRFHLSPKTVEHHLGSAPQGRRVEPHRLAARLAEPQPSAD